MVMSNEFLLDFLLYQAGQEKKTIEKELWVIADKLTPEDRVNDYTQAIMDLGATICTRSNPNCSKCPISRNCNALKQNKINDFPKKNKKNNSQLNI